MHSIFVSEQLKAEILFFFKLSTNATKIQKPTTNLSLKTVFVKVSYVLSLCAIELHCCLTRKLLKTHQWATLLHWLTCSFITTNTHCSLYWLKPTYTVLLPHTQQSIKCGFIHVKIIVTIFICWKKFPTNTLFLPGRIFNICYICLNIWVPVCKYLDLQYESVRCLSYGK